MPVNNTSLDATQVKITVLDPHKNTITEQTASTSVAAGQTATIPFSYTSSSTSALGIYHIDYTLLDASGNIIQPQAETDSGRFVVRENL